MDGRSIHGRNVKLQDCSSYTPDVIMMNKMKSQRPTCLEPARTYVDGFTSPPLCSDYFLDMGGLVEDQEVLAKYPLL